MMRGLGTVLNAALILFGGFCGLLFGRWIKPRLRETLVSATGVAVMMLAVGGVMEKMLTVTEEGLSASGSICMIVSLALGGIVGELLNLEGGIARIGDWLKRKSGNGGDAAFVESFVSASCTVCIGAMAIVGSIADGISGDYSILLAKGVLDAVIICMMTASAGKGSIFSVFPVIVLQGSITALAALLGDFLPEAGMNALSLVGSVLIFCVGLNLIRKEKIRVANLLPAVVFAAVFGMIF